MATIRLIDFEQAKHQFSNNRQWREFVAAIAAVHDTMKYPVSVTYPKVINALRSGRDWFNTATIAAPWLGQREAGSDALNLGR